MPHNPLPYILQYWRNSLADDAGQRFDNINLDKKIHVNREQIKVGQIPEHQTWKIFNEDPEQRSPHTPVNEQRFEEENALEVLVLPVVGWPKSEHSRKIYAKSKPICPICIPAVIDAEGRLAPSTDSPPWIPREFLEPVLQPCETIGDVDAVDEFLALNPEPKNYSENDRKIEWSDSWHFSNLMLQHVSGLNLETFSLEGYIIDRQGYLIHQREQRRGASTKIIQLYDHILQSYANESNYKFPKLLERFASLDDAILIPCLSPDEEISKSAEHYGQMSPDFALSPSQRQALHHILSMKHNEILAVNGPPGTGKTTLLQSVVATLWIEAALKKAEPPLIVVSSTNNQAVTNVIDSFGAIPEHNSSLGRRWIDEITSFALYCPSASRQKFSQAYQITTWRNDFLLPEQLSDNKKKERINIDTATFSQDAEKTFLRRLTEHLHSRKETPAHAESLESAIDYLHVQLSATIQAIKEGPLLMMKINELTKNFVAAYENHGGIEAYINSKHSKLNDIQQKRLQLKEEKTRWLDHAATLPYWTTLLNFLPNVKERIALEHRRFFENNTMIEPVAWDTQNIINAFDHHDTLLQEQEYRIKTELEAAQNDNSSLNKQLVEWEKWKSENLGPEKESDLLDHLDRTLRHEAFMLATHYWEAKWLQEMKIMTTTRPPSPLSLPARQQRWRRFAKLTPCMVATLHTLPNFFQELYNYIDLLIIDEAGQVSPEIAAASFSLASKALVVGDIQQIQPVRGITRHIDEGNLKRYSYPGAGVTPDTLRAAGLSASEGNTMYVAQRASKYRLTNHHEAPERGMFLAEHRRCVPEIIDYCNELAYSGRLISKRPSDETIPLPFIGYAHIHGESIPEEGSRKNDAEASVIAKWIAGNRTFLLEHYKSDSLEKIVAIITPFRRQAILLDKALKEEGITESVKTGTIHVLQGSERPIVIFSPVYGTNDPQPYFFDHGVNMLNVAVSRAKDSFLVFGNMNIFNSDDTSKPSGLLARYLFISENNEITDIDLLPRKNISLSPTHPHINTLEGHRKVLRNAFQAARNSIRIFSPFIRIRAINDDGIPQLVTEALRKNVEVTIYTDPELNRDDNDKKQESRQFREGIALLSKSGAIIKYVKQEHSKTLMVDDNFLIEGSFNWLSAVRNRKNKYHRSERSLRYTGGDIKALIEKIVHETEEKVTRTVTSCSDP